jgi:hypothetical protein
VNFAKFIVFCLFAGFGCEAAVAIVPLMMNEIVPQRLWPYSGTMMTLPFVRLRLTSTQLLMKFMTKVLVSIGSEIEDASEIHHTSEK